MRYVNKGWHSFPMQEGEICEEAKLNGRAVTWSRPLLELFRSEKRRNPLCHESALSILFDVILVQRLAVWLEDLFV